ncbi:MAG: autotransporter outer membrane beta-barrel domain-containing protein [Sutterellaceae bacterium]|nr:autotransporter outer membrane beta-barrel domain-containing protein [Sutterellaceae bacterium]
MSVRNIGVETAKNARTVALEAENGVITVSGDTDIALGAEVSDTYQGNYRQDGDINTYAFAIYASKASTIDFRNANHKLQGTIFVADATSKVSVAAGGESKIFSDIYNTSGGTVDLALDGATSVFEGQVDDFLDKDNQTRVVRTAFADRLVATGNTTLTLGNEAKWISRGKSQVSKIAFNDYGATVDLTSTPGGAVMVKELSGNGTFTMRLGNAMSGAQDSNMLYIGSLPTDRVQTIDLSLAGVDSADSVIGARFATTLDALYKSENPTQFKVVSKDAGFNNLTFVVKNASYSDEGQRQENASFNGQDAGVDSNRFGEDVIDAWVGNSEATNWYIDSYAEKPVADAGLTILSTAKAYYWAAIEMDRLNKRLADTRYADGDHGLWARVRHDRIGTDSGIGDFRAHNTTYQVGYDYRHHGDDSDQLYGVALDYMQSDTDYKQVKGDADNKRFGVTVYTTWLNHKGWYADLVAKWGRLSNKFTLVSDMGNSVSADYDNDAYGISFEFGRNMENEDGWFVEPQAQLQYVHIEDAQYQTTQGTRMDHDGIDSVISRVGFRAGRVFGDAHRSTVYVKSDWMKEWEGKQKVTAYDVTTPVDGTEIVMGNRGNWFDVGFGVQATMSDDSYAYADVEYRFGNDLYRTWLFNAGVRIRF